MSNVNPCNRTYPKVSYPGECTSTFDIALSQEYCNIGVRNGEKYNTGSQIIRNSTGKPCAIGFRQRVCTKTGWNMDNQLDCCLGNINSNSACAPSWCPNTPICANALKVYCEEGNNIQTDACRQVCNANDGDPVTKEWCDVATTKYCSNAGISDSYCSCINSKNSPALYCADASCTGSSYRTKQIQQDINACLNGGLVICQSAVNCLGSGTCNITDPTFIQNCSSQGVDIKSSSDNTTNTTNTTNSNTSFIYIIIAIVVVIVIIIIIIIIYNFSGDGDGDDVVESS